MTILKNTLAAIQQTRLNERMRHPVRFLQYLCLIICAGCSQAKEQDMRKIQFDLGKNISEVANESNAPHFSVRNLQGLVSYSVNDLSPSAVVAFNRPLYQIDVPSLFALTMYADEENHNDLAVSIVTLQVSNEVGGSHESARRYIENIVQQFNKGKWTRYLEEDCPALTGRSVFLDEAGELNADNTCGLDPRYAIPESDWLQLIQSTQHYAWTGDGVHATLTAFCLERSQGLAYYINLEFRDLDIKKRNDKQRLAQSLAEGDREGFNSTADYLKEEKERAKKNKILKANAVKRGDPLFTWD